MKNRLTDEQVVRGMEFYLSQHCGKQIRLNPQASLLEYEADVSGEEFCPLDFLEDMANYFGFERSASRWSAWLKVPQNRGCCTGPPSAEVDHWTEEFMPTRTVQSLVDLFRKRSPGISFDPVNLFGQTCRPAGVFTGICDAARMDTEPGRIAPSSRISDAVSLATFRKIGLRLNWLTGCEIVKRIEYPEQDQPGTLSVWIAGIVSSLLAWAGGCDALSSAIVAIPVMLAFGFLLLLTRWTLAVVRRYATPLDGEPGSGSVTRSDFRTLTFRELTMRLIRLQDDSVSGTFVESV